MKKDNIADNYFGYEVKDPYRWLEDDNSKETKEWSDKQMINFKENISKQKKEEISQFLKDIWDYEKRSVPFIEAGKLFQWRNSGLQNQFSLYMIEEDKATLILDPNTMSDEGTVEISGYSVSPDGKFLAYSISESGSDWQVIKVKDLNTLKDLEDSLEYVRFSSMTWNKESNGFYYSGYPMDKDMKEEERTRHCRLNFHKLGQEQIADEIILNRPEDPDTHFYVENSKDKLSIIVNLGSGTKIENNIWIKRNEDKDFIKLFDNMDAEYIYIHNEGDTYYFLTSKDSPKMKVISVDISSKTPVINDTIPESDCVIDSVEATGGRFVIKSSKDAQSILSLYDYNGNYIKNIELPGICSVNGLFAKHDQNDIYYSVSSYTIPPTIYKYNVKDDEIDIFYKSDFKYDTSDLKTVQKFFISKDGTKVPMFITGKKEIIDNKKTTHCLMYGYGGFGVSLNPGFSLSDIAWYKSGGIKAIVNLRGGFEYGEGWHRAGMHENKQNVYDDFICAGEYLVNEGYTSQEKLAIEGGSNGGLLVGTCINQRPDLFKAAICAVPLTDMLRFHKFTIGRYWISEYGNPEGSKKEFETIYAYSPYHNIKSGVMYPNTLILTADTDDRVVPAHARKFAARLQDEVKNPEDIFIRIEKNAGHGHGKPTSKIIDEIGDKFTFLLQRIS